MRKHRFIRPINSSARQTIAGTSVAAGKRKWPALLAARSEVRQSSRLSEVADCRLHPAKSGILPVAGPCGGSIPSGGRAFHAPAWFLQDQSVQMLDPEPFLKLPTPPI